MTAPVTGRVVGRSTSLWNSQIIINKGTDDGVRQDMPVVASDTGDGAGLMTHQVAEFLGVHRRLARCRRFGPAAGCRAAGRQALSFQSPLSARGKPRLARSVEPLYSL